MFRALRALGFSVLVLLGLLVAVNALAPAVARAQAISSGGGSTVDVVAALVGKDVTATSYMATAASGATGFGCTFNGCRYDFGAGANDYCSSDGSTITCGASLALAAGQSFKVNILSNVSGNTPITFIAGSGGVIFSPGTLSATACGTNPITEGAFRIVAATTGVATKTCTCIKDSAGAFMWRNETTGTTGTTTTCP